VLDNVIGFFSMILREFKKGPEHIFKKLEELLDEIFGFGQKVGDNALTEAEKNAKKIQSERARKIDPVKRKRIKQHEDFVKK
jgi:hypothetical protein